MINKVTGHDHYTNATAESLFFVVKQSFMKGEMRWECDKFITTMSGHYKYDMSQTLSDFITFDFIKINTLQAQ